MLEKIKSLSRKYLEQFPDFDNHQQVLEYYNDEIGLRAFIAIHNTHRGPALGGCRMYPYPSRDEAITDVLRLSRTMTYKAALADLPLGGGKAVIIGDPKNKKPELLHHFGQFVNILGGTYITTEDSGINARDIPHIGETTKHVVGIGTPYMATAYGVRASIHAAVRHRYGKSWTVGGLRVSIQGLGGVGLSLAKFLHQDGAKILVSDIQPERITLLKSMLEEDTSRIEKLRPDNIFSSRVHVFAPCAFGAILNDHTIPHLRAHIVAGAANNQLADEKRHGEMLRGQDVSYVPDYLANAGGIIEAGPEMQLYDVAEMWRRVKNIGETTIEVLARAETEERPANEIANEIAEERFAKNW